MRESKHIITRFEFSVRPDVGPDIWIAIKGPGGYLGGGCAHVDPQDTPRLERLCTKLLGKAAHQLESDGFLRASLTLGDSRKPMQVLRIVPKAVVAVRVRLGDGSVWEGGSHA